MKKTFLSPPCRGTIRLIRRSQYLVSVLIAMILLVSQTSVASAVGEQSSSSSTMESGVDKNSPAPPSGGKIMRLLLTESRSFSFNPLTAASFQEQLVNQLLYFSLCSVDSKGALQSDILESYSIDDDDRAIHLRLKPWLSWQDGRPLTSKDLEFSFLNALNPASTHPLRSVLSGISGISKIAASNQLGQIPGVICLNDQELELKFDSSASKAWKDLAFIQLIPRHIWWEKEVSDWNEQPALHTRPIGSGPFRQIQSTGDGQYSFFSDSDVGLPQAKINRIDIRFVPRDEMIKQLLEGQVHLAELNDIPPPLLNELEQKGYQIQRIAGDDLICLLSLAGVESHASPLGSQKSRDIFRRAIQLDSVLDLSKSSPLLDPTKTTLPTYKSFSSHSSGAEESSDSATLLDQLLEAGWKTKISDHTKITQLQKSSERIEIKECPTLFLSYPADDPLVESIALFIRHSFEKIGVELRIQALKPSDLTRLQRENNAFALLLLRQPRRETLPPFPCLPLAVPTRGFVYKALLNFYPDERAPFGNSAAWELK